MSAARNRRSVKRGRRGRLRRAALRVLFVILAACGVWVAYEVWTWPDVAALARTDPKTTAFIERWRQERCASGLDDAVHLQWTRWAGLSPHLIRATIVAEDGRFFSHHGFDTEEIRKALADALEDREMPRGASTITQQLAKNLWLSPSRNPLRKLREALLTRQLESRLS